MEPRTYYYDLSATEAHFHYSMRAAGAFHELKPMDTQQLTIAKQANPSLSLIPHDRITHFISMRWV